MAKKISGGDYLVALGPTMSSCALAATPVYYRNQTPNIITYSNANTITEQGFDNLVRLTYTTKSIAQYMAEQAKGDFKANKVAVISENQDYGQQLLNSFKSKAKEIGLEITTESVITPGQDVDFKAVLLKAKDKNPDILILFVTYNEGGLLVKQTRELGWDIPIYAPDALTEPKFFALAGALDNVFLQVSPNVDVERPAAKVLKEQWNKKYEGFPPLAAIYGYDAVKLAVKVIEAGGVDRASFIQNMKKVQMEGVANPVYSFDEAGDGKSPNFVTIPAAKYYKDNF